MYISQVFGPGGKFFSSRMRADPKIAAKEADLLMFKIMQRRPSSSAGVHKRMPLKFAAFNYIIEGEWVVLGAGSPCRGVVAVRGGLCGHFGIRTLGSTSE